jgi:peptidylprolyl isomerase
VIAGWTEGVPLMVVGEKRRFWIPVELAYRNEPGKPAGMLVFDIELLSFKPGPKAIQAPADCKTPPADAAASPSGLQWKVLTPGTGTARPAPDDIATLEIEAWMQADGRLFNSSRRDGRPVMLKPSEVALKGFQEVIPLMAKGEKRRVWLTEALAFAGRHGAPPGGLCVEMELLAWKAGPKPVPAPADVAAPPADAAKQPSGLASKVLTEGKGAEHPMASSTVRVHYTGWTTDGKMFDSSVARGEPAEFSLGAVIPGWTEGVQLMVEGEKRRFWIPAGMAYNNQPGKPAGMLVFDVELLKIVSR